MNDTASLAEVIADFLYPDLVRSEDLENHLAYTEKTIRRISEEAVGINLERMDDGLKDQVPKSWRILDRPVRTLATLVGAVTYRRRVYADEYGCRRYLLDEVLGIAAYSRIETSAFLWIVAQAANISFEKTRRAFLDRTGITIARTTVMRCVHKEGELLAAAGTNTDDALPISTPVIFSEFDGFYVNLQVPMKTPARPRRTYKEQFKKKSRELKVWVSYAGIKNSKRAHPVHWASDASPAEFFKECLDQASSTYDLDDAESLVVGSDGAGWCKNHALDCILPKTTTVISKLDTFHVNQRVYRAFSSEEDRKEYLGYLYARDFDGFFIALGKRIEAEPTDERVKLRGELREYIANNLDWLDGMTLSKHIREGMLADLPLVFGDRPFYARLHDLLVRRCYKRFIATLEKIVAACASSLRLGYEGFLAKARSAIERIKLYRPAKLGTMEGTNAKVYAARLKVWGCAWSERGAIAMMRIRATIHSGKKLIAPRYNPWLSEREKKRIEAYRRRTFRVPESEGTGWEAPQASVVLTTHMPPRLYGLLNT